MSTLPTAPLPIPAELRPLAERLFGERLDLAEQYTRMLAVAGPERGLIGPREVERLWERHILNSALLVDALDADVRTLADVGSGAGLPGVLVAIARPELEVTLIETMQRRTIWLEEVDEELGLGMRVLRARAEEVQTSPGFDVVTARAVAALDKLSRWTLPLVRDGGELIALKGSSAAEEIEKAGAALRKLGGVDPRIELLGEGEVEVPTTVVRVRREAPRSAAGTHTKKGGQHG